MALSFLRYPVGAQGFLAICCATYVGKSLQSNREYVEPVRIGDAGRVQAVLMAGMNTRHDWRRMLQPLDEQPRRPGRRRSDFQAVAEHPKPFGRAGLGNSVYSECILGDNGSL